MDAKERIDLLSEAFGLNQPQRRLILRVGWVVFVTGHIAWVCGFLAPLGIASPFANAKDVAQVVLVQRQLQVELLEQRIFDQRIRHCRAVDAGNDEAVRFYAEALRSLLRDYSELTNREYRLPRCGEV